MAEAHLDVSHGIKAVHLVEQLQHGPLDLALSPRLRLVSLRPDGIHLICITSPTALSPTRRTRASLGRPCMHASDRTRAHTHSQSHSPPLPERGNEACVHKRERESVCACVCVFVCVCVCPCASLRLPSLLFVGRARGGGVAEDATSSRLWHGLKATR
jgi:hypothetical protein